MRRTPSPLVSPIVAVVLVLVTVVSCGGGGKPSHPAATTADVPVTVAHGATVRLGGGTKLVIPPDAVSADGHLIAHTGGVQVGTNLGLDGQPGAAEPVFAPAGNPVMFELIGAKLVHPASLTVQVNPTALAQAGSAATRPDAAWLAFYDAAAHHWQPVESRYDPATHSVTAQVPHLSTWNPFTLDWSGIALRLRQSLSAFGSGRAPATTCAKVQGITVTMAGGNDPPLIGCPAVRGPDTLTVSMTNNRGISMVMSGVPPDATQDPPSYRGFDEYIATRPNTTHMLGGAYLPPSGTLTYSLPLHGQSGVFTAAPTLPSYALDLASVIGEDLAGAARFGKVSGDYGTCILNAVTRSEPASFADVPRVAVTCVPVLLEAVTGFKGLGSPVMKLFQFDVAVIIQDYDLARDDIRGVSGEVDITRVPAPTTEDWKNRQYGLTCDDIVQTPVSVSFHDGKGTAVGTDIGNYNRWDLHIQQIANGVLPSLGAVTAVLFYCSPQPSNFFTQELRVYRTGDGGEIGRIPRLQGIGSGSAGNLPGVYNPGTIAIRNGQVTADAMFYGPGDSHASGPSILRHLTWRWNGQEFMDTSPQSQTSPAGTCPNSAQLLSAWNAAPVALRDSWVGVPVTGFNNITCWNDWVVSVPVSSSPGNGNVVFSLVGNLHLITTTELQQEFRRAVCSSSNAPPDWKVPPLISCT